MAVTDSNKKCVNKLCRLEEKSQSPGGLPRAARAAMKQPAALAAPLAAAPAAAESASKLDAAKGWCVASQRETQPPPRTSCVDQLF